MNRTIARITELLEGRTPKTALVLGSGLGGLAAEVENAVRIPYAELPVFPQSGVTDHARQLVAGDLAGMPIVMLADRAHYYTTTSTATRPRCAPRWRASAWKG